VNKEVKVSSFGEENNLLLIDSETIRFQEKEMQRDKITGIKYWISAIEFYEFPIGRKYHIGLKTSNEKIDIIFKSYFGVGNSYFFHLCTQIIDEIWEPIIGNILETETVLLSAGGAIQFGHCQISKDGVLISRESRIGKNRKLIGWTDLQYEKKYDKLVLNSKNDPGVWTNLYFKDCWNIEVLLAFLDWITIENGLAEIQK
jgi:hypothetical protein